MKNSTKIAISLVVGTLLLTGCSTEETASEYTDVTVERGAVYDANVRDSNGTFAKSVDGTNVYRFSNTPAYPIFVTDGWIDVDGDKQKTVRDVPLGFIMKSYSNIVTPITTYTAQETNETKREQKLEELAEIMNIPNNDTTYLKTLPSDSNIPQTVVYMQNSIYKTIKENNNIISLLNTDTIESNYNAIQNSVYESNDYMAVEKQVMLDLEASGDIKFFVQSEIDAYTEQLSASQEVANEDEDKSILDTVVDTVEDGVSDLGDTISNIISDDEEEKEDSTPPSIPEMTSTSETTAIVESNVSSSSVSTVVDSETSSTSNETSSSSEASSSSVSSDASSSSDSIGMPPQLPVS